MSPAVIRYHTLIAIAMQQRGYSRSADYEFLIAGEALRASALP